MSFIVIIPTTGDRFEFLVEAIASVERAGGGRRAGVLGETEGVAMRIAIKPQPHGGAVSWHRGTGPGAYLSELGHEVVYLHSAILKPDRQRELVRTADLVHVISPAGSYENASQEWHERGGALSVDLDDDVWVWLDDPARATADAAKLGVATAGSKALTEEGLRELESWLKAADVVTTTTEYLAGVIRKRMGAAVDAGRKVASFGTRPRVDVVPNAIPPEGQRARPRRVERMARSTVMKKAGLVPDRQRVVGWTGSVAHIADLPPVLEALARIRSVDGTVSVRSLGPVDWMQSPGFREVFTGKGDYAPVVWHNPKTGRPEPQVPFELYFDTLEAMEADVAVIPMRASPFNMGKSAVTLYAWAVQGVPVVCSRTGPYEAAQLEGFPALYVDHEDRDAWVGAIRRLLYEPAEASELARRALAWVLERHAFPKAAEAWARAFEGARERMRWVEVKR